MAFNLKNDGGYQMNQGYQQGYGQTPGSYDVNQALFGGQQIQQIQQSGASYAGLYQETDQISSEKYNLVIGGCLLWGFLVNVFMVKFMYESIALFAVKHFILFLVGYFVMAIAGSIMVNKSDNPVISFIGYNLFVLPLGMILTIVLNVYTAGGYENTITLAFGITAAVTLLMMALSTAFPQFFLSMGKTLAVTLIITIVIEFILMLAGFDLAIIDYIVVLIFCGYIGYDWAKANAKTKTVDNAIDSAAALYVDIVNLFLRILRILARARN